MRVNFELTGKTSLLMHWDNVEESDRVKAWQRDPANKNLSVAGDDRSPAWTWATYMYHDGNNVVIPSQNLMVCLRQAGAQMILKRQKTFKEITQSGLFIEDEFLEFETEGRTLSLADATSMIEMPFDKQKEEVNRFDFRLYIIRARVGTSKHVRVRPRFDSWKARGCIEIIAPEITYENLTQLFDIAGRVGLGDWRPGCKTPGPFGQFRATIKKA